MRAEVLNIQGKKTGRTVELPDAIFGIEPNDHVIYLAVKQYRAAQHLGTHKVKTRAEAKGASRKLHRQKGTGGSRKGNIRNPLYKGGGAIFGPQPHSYVIRLNRKVKDLARKSALSYKAKEKAIVVVEDIRFEKPKTKEFSDILRHLNIDGKKTLFVQPGYDEVMHRSYRNIPGINGMMLSDINTYDLINADVLLIAESAAKVFSDQEAAAEA